MLTHTFCHIPRVGVKTENRLWSEGVATWDDLRALDGSTWKGFKFSRPALSFVLQHLDESETSLERLDARYFRDALPPGELWRAYPAFRDHAAYVDIETVGAPPPEDHITAIALWDGHEARHYVHGRNLDDFMTDIRDYKLLVTFNGKCFDAPYIERTFGEPLDMLHLDLRFMLKAAGIAGGLKKCEKHFGLDRGELDGVDGYHAVLLWREFQATGDERFLETLVAYNIEDVLGLELLAREAYNILASETPFGAARRLRAPLPGFNPVPAHPECIALIRNKYLGRYFSR